MRIYTLAIYRVLGGEAVFRDLAEGEVWQWHEPCQVKVWSYHYSQTVEPRPSLSNEEKPRTLHLACPAPADQEFRSAVYPILVLRMYDELVVEITEHNLDRREWHNLSTVKQLIILGACDDLYDAQQLQWQHRTKRELAKRALHRLG